MSTPKTLTEFVAFLETGDPGAFAADAVADFNFPSVRFTVHGADAIAAERGPGRWKVDLERVRPTDTGYVAELTHSHAGEAYHTLNLVTVDNGRITELVHYCTGNSA